MENKYFSTNTKIAQSTIKKILEKKGQEKRKHIIWRIFYPQKKLKQALRHSSKKDKKTIFLQKNIFILMVFIQRVIKSMSRYWFRHLTQEKNQKKVSDT